MRVLISPGAGQVNAEVIEVCRAFHIIIEDQLHDFGAQQIEFHDTAHITWVHVLTDCDIPQRLVLSSVQHLLPMSGAGQRSLKDSQFSLLFEIRVVDAPRHDDLCPTAVFPDLHGNRNRDAAIAGPHQPGFLATFNCGEGQSHFSSIGF